MFNAIEDITTEQLWDELHSRINHEMELTFDQRWSALRLLSELDEILFPGNTDV